MKKRILLPLLLVAALAVSFRSSAQKKLDSITTVIRLATHDTTRAYAYVALTEELYASKPDTIIPLCNKALALVNKNLPDAGKKEKRSFLFTKAAALNNIAFIYHMRGEEEKALDYFQQSLTINKEIGAQREIANALSNMGAILQQQGKASEAIGYLSQALKIQEAEGIKGGMAYTLNNISALYDQQGQMQKALDHSLRALKLHEELKDDYGAATCLNNLGALYMKQGQLNKGLEYYAQSLALRKKLDDKQGIATCLHNMGYVYERKGEQEKALQADLEGLKIYEAIGDKRGIANSLHNIAAIYEAQGKNDIALEYYGKSVKIYEAMGDKRGLSNSLNNIGAALVRTKQAAKAKPYLERALREAQEGSYVEGIRTAHFNQAKLDSALGNGAAAYEHYKQYIVFRDSLSNVSTRKIALKKQLQYEYEKKEALAKQEQEKKEVLLNEELKRQKLIRWSAVGTISLLLLSALLLLNRYRLKQKNRYQQQLNDQQKEQAVAVMDIQEQERKRIAEDLHDSLGHLLSTAKLNLQTLPKGEKQVENSLNLLNQASEEIRNITFNLMPRTLEEGGLIPALNELATKVTHAGAVKVLLHVHDMEKFVLEKQSQFNIYRIVQEAVNNILKHADAQEINIQLIGQQDHITIMIEDDGKGFNPETNKTGRGLKNIVTRSLWLKGNINIDSTPGRGTTITTEIPV